MTDSDMILLILDTTTDVTRGTDQLMPDQLAAFRQAVGQLHDFNLGRRPDPGFEQPVLARLSDFEAMLQNDQLLGNS